VADALRNGHLRDQLRQVRTNIKFLRHLVRGRRERNAQSKTLLRKLEVSNSLRQERLPKFVDKVEKIRQEFLFSLTYHALSKYLSSVLRIRIRRIHMFLGLPDPNLDPLVRDTNPYPDPSIIKQK
jgi:hypothetical protein